MRSLALLIIALATPALAQPAESAVLTTVHFAFFSDLATNVHDAIITAVLARQRGEPDPFSAGTGKACFDALAAADREGWTRAVDFYAMGKSTRLQRVLMRLELAGMLRRAELTDAENRAVLEDIARVRMAATPAYQRCRWPAQDEQNRRWIAGVRPLLAAHETRLAELLPALFKLPWEGLPFRVDVVETAPPVGADSASPDYPTVHILVSSSNSGNQDRHALEVVFHEATHELAKPDSPLGRALSSAFEAVGVALPRDFVHQVHFFMTGDVVRREFERNGESYVPYLYAFRLFSDTFRDAASRIWPAYIDSTRSLQDVSADLARAMK